MLDWNPQMAPLTFFSTAAGPSISDLVGPGAGVLNIFPDGEQIGAAETQLANGTGTGGAGKQWWRRADFHALLALIIGGAMIHAYTKGE
jgi:hypothetical protein